MSTRDDLLAQADRLARLDPGWVNIDVQALARDLAAVLRAVAAEQEAIVLDADRQRESYMAADADRRRVTAERDTLREFVAAHDALEELQADLTDDAYAYNTAVERLRVARAALDVPADTPEIT